jgi:hypothetical protein
LNEELVSVYPNPTNSSVNFKMSSTEMYEVSVFDAAGKLVLSENSITNGSSIQLNHVEKGIYFIQLFNENSKGTFRVIKE